MRESQAFGMRKFKFAITGLVPVIHVLLEFEERTWTAGSKGRSRPSSTGSGHDD